MNQITDTSQQNSINSHLRSSNKAKTPEKMLAQIEAWLLDEDSCHYFSIQIQGQEVYPFGVINRPFFHLDQAERKLEDLKSKNPKVCYYISYGAFDNSILDFEDENVPMWERVWLNQHKFRLTNLRIKKMSQKQLVELVPNYEEMMVWQDKLNTADSCHYYYAQAIDATGECIPMSSQFYFDLRDAISARIHFQKTMPNRQVEILSAVMPTASLMAIDGRTSDCFQNLIDDHKERLAALNEKGVNKNA